MAADHSSRYNDYSKIDGFTSLLFEIIVLIFIVFYDSSSQ